MSSRYLAMITCCVGGQGYSHQTLTTSSGLFTSYFWIYVPFRNSNCDSLSLLCVSPLPINMISSLLLLLIGVSYLHIFIFLLYFFMAADRPYFLADLCFLHWDVPHKNLTAGLGSWAANRGALNTPLMNPSLFLFLDDPTPRHPHAGYGEPCHRGHEVLALTLPRSLILATGPHTLVKLIKNTLKISC